jgi:uncharacterized protein (DUF302 family)
MHRILFLHRMSGAAMYHIVESAKSFDDACAALTDAVPRHGFGVLHVHDLGATLRAKGQDFSEQCRVFEVCNPMQAARVMGRDMRLNMALPCRISVYTEAGHTRLGMIDPVTMLGSLSDDASLAVIAQEVSETARRMMDDAR